VNDQGEPQNDDEREYTLYVMPSNFWGDIDGDNRLAVGDAILGLKILSRMKDVTPYIAGSNGGKISLQGIICILQLLAGLR
jgi:hypothetical protein